jgi:signal transduction histidine kinase
VDSLEQVLAVNPPAGEELVRTYYNLMWGYLQTDGEKLREYAQKCISEAVPIDAWSAVSVSYRLLGQQQWALTQYDSAMVCYGKALEAAGRMRDFLEKYSEESIDETLSLIYGSIGNVFNIQGKYPEAIEYYIRALTIFEKYDLKGSQSIAYLNIGAMYLSMVNHSQAEIYFGKLYSLAHETGDSLHIACAKYQLGSLYLSTQDYAQALQNAKAAYGYFSAHPEEDIWRLATLNLLSGIYLQGFDDDRQAEEYARQALPVAEKLSVPREKSIALGYLSMIYLKRQQWRQACQTALEALDADDTEPANTLSLYGILAKAYAQLGDAAKANAYFDKHDQLQSSWSTKNYQSAIREMEVKYETEKKAAQIATLETENRLLASEKRMMIWLGIAVGSILLLGLASLFFRWRWSQQKRRLAEQQIKQLEQEKQLVATQAVLDGEIQERLRLARDLHDGLGSILAAAKYNFADVKKTFCTEGAERFDLAVSLLDESMREMRRISHHLMPETLTTYGLKQSTADFCSSIPHATFNYYGDETRIAPKMEIMLYRIMHELVTNALKHSGAAHILVEIMRYDHSIALTVHDDGCGFDPAVQTHGMGLGNIRTRIAALNGTLILDSKPGGGTEVSVELIIEN